MELTGITLEHHIDGKSIVPLWSSKNPKTDGAANSYFDKGMSLRTSEYRLTRYYRDEKPVIELYDHTRNSLENKNIAEEYPEVVQRLLPILERAIAICILPNNSFKSLGAVDGKWYHVIIYTFHKGYLTSFCEPLIHTKPRLT